MVHSPVPPFRSHVKRRSSIPKLSPTLKATFSPMSSPTSPTARYFPLNASLEANLDSRPPPTAFSLLVHRAGGARRSLLIVTAGLLLFCYSLWSYALPVVPLVLDTNTYSVDHRTALSTALKYTTPQRTLRGQLTEGTKYLQTMYFGGQANQMLAMINLLYLAKHTGRVGILPQFTALHFKGTKQRADYIYDLARFYDTTKVLAVPLPAFKWRNSWYRRPQKEVVPCWSTMEIRTGSSNDHEAEGGWNAHNIFMSYWAVPPLPRTTDDYVVQLDSVLEFLGNRTWQDEYLERGKAEFLPQKWIPGEIDPTTIDPSTNIKVTFDPFAPHPPTEDDHLVCVDATYFMGHSAPPPPYPQNVPLDTWRTNAWREIGQHLHFTPAIERTADEYLMRIFGVDKMEDVPPFITVHIRRKDFKSFKGFTFAPIQHYLDAIAEVRVKIQALLDAPEGEVDPSREGRPAVRRWSIPPSEYPVLVTTDERAVSPFRDQMNKQDWKIIEHESLGTVDRFGEWYPAMLDGELLARGQGFVGTTWSTFSLLAGQRVEYWQGGAQVTARPGEKPAPVVKPQ